jgi:nucleotide-binding universal stress UspA family protein
MKRHTILIPLDGSSFSRQVLPHVQRLFDPATHNLILLRVGELPVGVTSAPLPLSNSWVMPTHMTARDVERARYPIYASQEEASQRATLERELRAEARALEEMGYAVRITVRFGDPAEEIVECARAQRADTVAMATHSRTGLRRFVLGSVAEQVLRDLDLPVMLVHPYDPAAN